MTNVSAGVIRREDGLILICQRGPGRRNAGLWEFPGGKWEAGEDACACLRRELMEELSLPVDGLRPWLIREAEGLRFFFVTGRALGEPVRREHQEVRFVRPRELLGLPFCPADAPVARHIALTEPRLTACVWDFDGTLADTYPGLTRRLMSAAGAFGVTLAPGRALDLMKISLSHALSTLSEEHGLPLQALETAWGETKAQVSLRRTPPIPGIPAAVRALSEAGCRHFLYTHNDRHALDFLDEQGLLPLFAGFITREDGFPRKPRPDALKHLMAVQGLAPEACVMIGDRPLDVEAGRAAGMLGCLLDPEGRFAATPCDLRAEKAKELPGLLLGKV